MSTYPGEDPRQPQDDEQGVSGQDDRDQGDRAPDRDRDDSEHTAPITPSGPVFNPTSAQSTSGPTTPYEQPPQAQQYPPPAYGQAPPPAYGQPPYQHTAYAPPLPSHPQSTLSMILGIVGLVGALMFCGLPLVVSPFAWALGRNALKEIAASQGRLRGESEARAGMIMGIIGTVLLGLAVLALIVFAVVLVANVSTV